MTVPAFGDWDMKNGAMPDYSMDFSKIREMRKQNKKELSRTSLGGDDDLLAHHKQQQPSKPAQPTEVAADARNVGGAPSRELEMWRILLDRIDGGAAEEPSCSRANRIDRLTLRVEYPKMKGLLCKSADDVRQKRSVIYY
ncbi:hypothetical protein D1007_08777 [Hordeum vulgare]|nr:hypothetical protein D1007_08777 [Hordeum vulgare]